MNARQATAKSFERQSRRARATQNKKYLLKGISFFLCTAQLKEKFFYRAVIKTETVFIGDYHESILELDKKLFATGSSSESKRE